MGDISYRVAAAVLVIDDFTDRLVSGSSIRMRVPGSSVKPIRKADGFFVFTTGAREIRQIEVESPVYHRALIDLESQRLNPGRPVLRVRLQPNRLYAASGKVTAIEGKAGPGDVIQVAPASFPQSLKLLYDYTRDGDDGGLTICLFPSEKKELSGKYLSIRTKEQAEAEVFRVLEPVDREQGLYALAEALKKDYKKAGASICPVFVTTADEKGEYFFLLPGPEGQEPFPCVVSCTGRKLKSLTADLLPGQVNRVDFV